MLNGIVIIATGHPYFGRMAYNLALSIQACEQTRICIVHDGQALSHLSEIQLRVFTDNKVLPEDYRTGVQAKLHLDQLTPYEQTIYLDADMVWIGQRKPSELFLELKGNNFTAITEGDSDNPNNKYYFWADPAEIKAVYKVQKVYQWRSEVMYFEKGTKLFKEARKLKPGNTLKSTKLFGYALPDELFINIATALLGIIPHKYQWTPAYWMRMHGEMLPKPAELANQYYLLSAGSNYASSQMKKSYDTYMRYAANKTGTTHLFPLKSKKEWLPERQKM